MKATESLRQRYQMSAQGKNTASWSGQKVPTFSCTKASRRDAEGESLHLRRYSLMFYKDIFWSSAKIPVHTPMSKHSSTHTQNVTDKTNHMNCGSEALYLAVLPLTVLQGSMPRTLDATITAEKFLKPYE